MLQHNRCNREAWTESSGKEIRIFTIEREFFDEFMLNKDNA